MVPGRLLRPVLPGFHAGGDGSEHPRGGSPGPGAGERRLRAGPGVHRSGLSVLRSAAQIDPGGAGAEIRRLPGGGAVRDLCHSVPDHRSGRPLFPVRRAMPALLRPHRGLRLLQPRHDLPGQSLHRTGHRHRNGPGGAAPVPNPERHPPGHHFPHQHHRQHPPGDASGVQSAPGLGAGRSAALFRGGPVPEAHRPDPARCSGADEPGVRPHRRGDHRL